ncbi:MAG: NAD(P)H-dependent oxidoreductase subunit E [Candidatus Zixiibacteriota bacterium]
MKSTMAVNQPGAQKVNDWTDILGDFKGVESDLIPILLRVQEGLGYISEEAVRCISLFLKLSENQIYGVASFYPKFRFSEPGAQKIKVCMGTACHVKGGHFLSDAVAWELGISIGQASADKRFDFQRATCLGCCTLAPVVQIDDRIHARVLVTQIKEILKKRE